MLCAQCSRACAGDQEVPVTARAASEVRIRSISFHASSSDRNFNTMGAPPIRNVWTVFRRITLRRITASTDFGGLPKPGFDDIPGQDSKKLEKPGADRAAGDKEPNRRGQVAELEPALL